MLAIRLAMLACCVCSGATIIASCTGDGEQFKQPPSKCEVNNERTQCTCSRVLPIYLNPATTCDSTILDGPIQCCQSDQEFCRCTSFGCSTPQWGGCACDFFSFTTHTPQQTTCTGTQCCHHRRGTDAGSRKIDLDYCYCGDAACEPVDEPVGHCGPDVITCPEVDQHPVDTCAPTP